LPLPLDKNTERKTNSPYDVFEFRDSDEEDAVLLDPLHSKNNDISKPTHSTEPENKKHIPEEHATTTVKSQEHNDQSSKEYVTELSQHGKLSITIRLHQKDSQDGSTAGTAEVVKTSKALLSDDDTKLTKNEPQVESNANKAIRKSARLMSQVPKTTIDETIEDVIKGTCKEESKSKRITRSSRRSEENIEFDDEPNEGLYCFLNGIYNMNMFFKQTYTLIFIN